MRFQVCTWSSDIGADDKMDFPTFTAALKDAKRYRKTEEYAAVYDRENKIAFVVFGNPFENVFADWVRVVSI